MPPTPRRWAMHVLVPLLIVEELDRLKRHSETKTRARGALKMLRVTDATTQPNGMLSLGPITMELLFDPPDHERLPDNDAEIVDRALVIQALAARPVTMVTYDKNMAFRARYAGLQAVSPPYPEHDEGQGRSRQSRGGGRSNRPAEAGTGQ
jgi:predicted ribonuclease YlaK